MSLVEPLYLAFLAAVVTLYYALPAGRARIALLALAGYAFYCLLSPRFWFVLVVVVLLAYLGGRLVGAWRDHRRGSVILAASVVLLLLPLVYYKYAAFVLGELDAVLALDPRWHAEWSAGDLLLPIGISFYVFQAIAYVADVYLGVAEAERDFVRFALFLAFFPILSAGPIERYARLMPQFDRDVALRAEPLVAGFCLIVLGLTLKFGIADPLSVPVDAVFRTLGSARPADQMWAAVFYSFQLYADLFGYSLIAIGSGLMLGIDLTWNFRQPFLSQNIQEFWRTWHITLSNWLRDYLFQPMRLHWRSWPRTGAALAVILTFLIIGIWHGAGWNFIIFGLAHGLFLAGSILTLTARNEAWRRIGVPLAALAPMRIVLTFMMVTISLIFIRSERLGEAWSLVRQFFVPANYADLLQFDARIFRPAYWACIAVLIGSDVLARRRLYIEAFPRIVRAAIFGICGSIILYAWVVDRVPQPFIYYRY